MMKNSQKKIFPKHRLSKADDNFHPITAAPEVEIEKSKITFLTK